MLILKFGDSGKLVIPYFALMKTTVLIPLSVLLLSCFVGHAQTISEFEGKVKITQLDTDNSADSLIVKLPDGTLGLRDARSITSFQVLSISNDTIFLQNGGFIKLPAGFDSAFSSLTGVPTGLSDGDDDTQLSDSDITALGYIKSADDADSDPTNEIQDLTPYQTIAGTSTWDKYASDDFDGAFGSLTGIPVGLSDGDDDTQLSNSDISALGYIKSADDADSDPTNEIQDLTPYQTIAGTSTWDKDASDDFDGVFSSLSGIPAGLSDGDDDTQLNDGDISALGYIKSANDADSDPTNEMQQLSISGDTLFLSNGGFVKLNSGTYSPKLYYGSPVLPSYQSTEQTKLTASDAAADDLFGYSVSISGDYAIVGSYFDDDAGSSSGSAYIFVRTGTTWSEQAKLTASDAAADDLFGYSVSISGDYAIVGAERNDDVGSNSGSAYIFVRTGTTWSEQAKLTASDAATNDNFGLRVSISGGYAIVGAYLNDDAGSSSGSAYIFVRTGTTWSEQAKLTASDAATNDNFGISVSISGGFAIVGARKNDDAGSAYIY